MPVTVPVIAGVVNAGEVIVWTPVNVLAASVRAMVASVDGNVIVRLSVDPVVASVRVLLTVSFLPAAKLVPKNESSQWAAVVGVATRAVKTASVFGAMVCSAASEEDCTATAPVELLMIMNC